MKNYASKLGLIFAFVVFLSSQILYGQENPNYLTFEYLLGKLTFTSRINRTNEEVNDKLIKEIQEKKVDFFLTDEKEKSIREARGTDFLIKAIRDNMPKSVEDEFKIKEIVRLAKEQKDKEEFEQKLKSLDEKSRFFAEAEILYEKFLKYRKGANLEDIKTAIKLGKEFIEKYGDAEKIKERYQEKFKKDFKIVIDYVKKQIPRLEEKVNSILDLRNCKL